MRKRPVSSGAPDVTSHFAKKNAQRLKDNLANHFISLNQKLLHQSQNHEAECLVLRRAQKHSDDHERIPPNLPVNSSAAGPFT
jgi:hypothetical protein